MPKKSRIEAAGNAPAVAIHAVTGDIGKNMALKINILRVIHDPTHYRV